MQFWACEVKSGESFKVQPGKGMVLHLSQANVGKFEFEKGRGNQSIFLFVNVDGKELILGSLNSKKLPQQQFDLLFDRDFELSHDWKCGSVYFFGYRATNPVEDRDIPMTIENGKPEEEESTSDDSTSDDYRPDEFRSDEDEELPMFKDDDATSESSEDEFDGEEDTPSSLHYKNFKLSSESEDEDDSEEDTPVKVVSGKTCHSKLETSVATGKVKATTLQKIDGKKGGVALVSNEKVKATTLQKTDGKKGGVDFVATPHPPTIKGVGETSCSDRKRKRRKQ